MISSLLCNYKVFNTQMQKSIAFSAAFFDEWERPIWPPSNVMMGYRLVPGVLAHNEQNHKCWRGVTGC